jgi:hypothetical protein
VRWRQLLDAGEERLVGVVDVPLLEVVAHGGKVRLERVERLELARELEPPVVPAVIEWLHAEAVA